MGEKTEQPTPKKLSDARKKGQVPSSKDLVSAALLVALFALLATQASTYFTTFSAMLLLPTHYLGPHFDFGFALQQTLNGLAALMLWLALPVLLVAAVVAIAAHVVQFGLLLAFESLKPDLKKLNPMEGIKKIFAVKNLIELLKSLIKIALLSVVLYHTIRSHLGDLVKLPYCGVGCVLPLLGVLMQDLAVAAGFAFLIIAGADFAFQRFQFTQQMKMTKDEVKREYKEMEGDPMIKSKRRQLHQELLAQNMENNVKRATVVVTNPTHIAVALEYREGETPLPVVLAKGERLMAARIVEIARREGIPIMENVPLAHALYADAQVDQYIPSDLIGAVAEVLRWVAQLAPPR